ncbi:MAG: ABC transporter permease [Magnetospirillum sp.]|nr:ABC transporter permease [Magnetospirillum sp.]
MVGLPTASANASVTASASLEPGAGGVVVVALRGDWRRSEALRAGAQVLGDLRAAKPAGVRVEAAGLEGWDSGLIAVLVRLRAYCADGGIPLDIAALPAGAARLLALASAVPERKAAHGAARAPLLARIGEASLARAGRLGGTVRLLGQVVLAFSAFLRGRARYRPEDLWRTVEETGARALPIVGIITLLIGLILAFIGAVQLEQFGASIYVADLVGLAMTREMAAVMTAIVLAGRTGAAFAAQLGTMQGNEEIDALETLGIPPVEFLVLPRMLALGLMMPVLYVYGCFIGLFGGFLVGTGMLHLSVAAYVDRTQASVHMDDFMIGFVKSVVFGLVVAFAGCQRGIEAGRSAAGVGLATTQAVVSAIVYIIAIDALFAVLLNVLGI